jgi:hypothetical protein
VTHEAKVGNLRRRCRLFCVCGGVIALLNLQEAREAYVDSQRNLQKMQAMVDEIEFLRAQANTAQLLGEQPKQTIKPWTDRASRIGAAQPSSFSGSPLQPIAKSDYSQESVSLALEDVTLKQAIQFLTDSNDSSGYIPTVVDLRASAIKPSSPSDEERWTANLILTRLIYTAINQSGD